MPRKVWDISPMIRPGIPVWPGDTHYSEERTWALDESCPVNVSRFAMSTHTGAHTDAPLHYDAAGVPIADVPLSHYLGPCQVMDVRGCGPAVRPSDFADRLQPGIRRVLFRTYDQAPQDQWDDGFTAVDATSIRLLAEAGVILVGLDTPSLDPQTSKTMDAHHAVRDAGMMILEGVVLDNVAEGVYELIALPLKLANMDAAPVRAILRDLETIND
ncbi:arylformamidase [Aestuariispira insulae]|nr:arylformamidase [Aestuariispira insulae]